MGKFNYCSDDDEDKMNLRWRAVDDNGWTAAAVEDGKEKAWRLDRLQEIVAGVPLLMKIEEEARSRELLRRSLSLLKSSSWRLDRDRFCGE